jgi:ring-1,2-phenylacetyl-CoA epoxidase subunit PaaD
MVSAVLDARTVAESVSDPELPMLTLADLGVLRDVQCADDGTVVVSITPTYSGCPAMDTMRDDLIHALQSAGFPDVVVRRVLSPAWTSDWISEDGRSKLAAAGIAPPAQVPERAPGPVPLTLGAPVSRVPCPHCGSADTQEQSRFSSTACKALHRCHACGEPFEHFKEI